MPIKKLFKKGKGIIGGAIRGGLRTGSPLGALGGALRGAKGKGKGILGLVGEKKRQSRGLSLKFLRNYKVKIIKAKLRAKLMKEELKAFKGI